MKRKLSEPRSGILTLKYQPEGGDIGENPPRFSWLPANRKNGEYVLQVARDVDFCDIVYVYKNIKRNFFAPDVCFDAGEYFWRYTLEGGEHEYSSVRKFVVTDELIKSPFPSEKDRFANVSTAHPRLWLDSEGIKKFQSELAKNPSHCKFDTFVEKTVLRYADAPFVSQPLPYPGGVRETNHWRASWVSCQEAFNHIRYVGIAGVILQNDTWIAKAKDSLLQATRWDIHGTTSRNYNDECGFKMAIMLAWGYDWLYHYLTEEERAEVRANLEERTAEIVHHAFVESKIHYSLYDSHAVRSVSMCVVPCTIALFGDSERAEGWLSEAVDYYNVLFAPWGGKEGGWSEGPFYWTAAMAFLLDSAGLLKNFTGIDILLRPFMQNTADFPIYCASHDMTARCSFSDHCALEAPPLLKAGFNAREFGVRNGDGVAEWYYQKLAEKGDFDTRAFYSAGWWDFYFCEMVALSNYGKIEATPPTNGRIVKWFKDIGWVALHKDMADEENHIALLTKSSKYGSVSHANPDQNAITLFAFGEALLCETGYYIGFNCSFHRDWRCHTRAHNAIEINEQSQYENLDKTKQLSAVGEILSVEETENYVHIVQDATKAYLHNVPTLEKYTREIYFVDDEYFVIVDDVTLSEDGDVSYYLHSLFPSELKGESVVFAGEKAKAKCEIVLSTAGVESMRVTDEFEGVKESEWQGKEKHHHFQMKTRKGKKHIIVSVICPSKVDEYKEIGTIKDDQGHDIFLYFVNDGKTFPLVIDGDKRY